MARRDRHADLPASALLAKHKIRLRRISYARASADSQGYLRGFPDVSFSPKMGMARVDWLGIFRHTHARAVLWQAAAYRYGEAHEGACRSIYYEGLLSNITFSGMPPGITAASSNAGSNFHKMYFYDDAEALGYDIPPADKQSLYCSTIHDDGQNTPPALDFATRHSSLGTGEMPGDISGILGDI